MGNNNSSDLAQIETKNDYLISKLDQLTSKDAEFKESQSQNEKIILQIQKDLQELLLSKNSPGGSDKDTYITSLNFQNEKLHNEIS